MQTTTTAPGATATPPARPLLDKVVLVTGGARGIGRAAALKLAAAGCDVAVNYYSSHEEAESLADAIRRTGRRAALYQGNVADPDSVKELFDALLADFDRVDIVVSNAASGVLRPAPRWSTSTTPNARGSKKRGSVVEQPAPGPTCTNSTGCPSGLPHCSTCKVCSGVTGRCSTWNGSIAG